MGTKQVTPQSGNQEVLNLIKREIATFESTGKCHVLWKLIYNTILTMPGTKDYLLLSQAHNSRYCLLGVRAKPVCCYCLSSKHILHCFAQGIFFSTEDERSFSSVGLFITKLRCSLNDTTIDKLCFLRSHFLSLLTK